MERVFRFFVFAALLTSAMLMTGCVDCWPVQVPFYSQVDDRWAYDQMGDSDCNIGNCGCLITSVTMAYNYYGIRVTPAQFNEWLGDNNGYDGGGNLYWNKINEFGQGDVWYSQVTSSQLADTLDGGYPVLAQVNNGAHWILIVGRTGDYYYVLDPAHSSSRAGRLLMDYNATGRYYAMYGADASNSIYDQAVSRAGGTDVVGDIQHTQTFGEHGVHWYHGEWRSEEDDVLVQNRKGGDFGGHSGIVFDSVGGGRKAYWVRTGFWNEWTAMGGPQSWLGAPINEEYWNGTDNEGRGQARQDFTHGYLWWSGAYVTVNHYPYATPGWFDDQGWDNSRSYAFAEAYERNGARNYLGEAMGTVHDWNGVEIQDFDWAGYGHCAIIANPENNGAYLVRSGFWSWYANHNGPGTLGYPCQDEVGRGNTSSQRFEKGTLNYDGSSVNVTYKSDHGCGMEVSAGSGSLAYGSGGDESDPEDVEPTGCGSGASVEAIMSANADWVIQVWHNGQVWYSDSGDYLCVDDNLTSGVVLDFNAYSDTYGWLGMAEGETAREVGFETLNVNGSSRLDTATVVRDSYGTNVETYP